VSKAALELNMTQSAASRQIRNLETILDARLFNRENQRLYITDTGKRYLAEISPLLIRLRAITLEIQGGEEWLTIAADPSITSRWLIPYLKSFNKKNPTIHTDIHTHNSPLDHIDVYDIAIDYNNPTPYGHKAEMLFEEELIAVCAPELLEGKPIFIDYKDIIDYPLLHHSDPTSTTNLWLEKAGLEIDNYSGQRFDHFSLLIDAAREGMGVTVVPRFFVELELKNGLLVEACEKSLITGKHYYIVIPNDKVGIRNVEIFREWLLTCHQGVND
jgi:DNA-binding transcriptional LysR family regulator